MKGLFRFLLIITYFSPTSLSAQKDSVLVLKNIPSSDLRISLVDAESLDNDTLELFVNDFYEDLIPINNERFLTNLEVSTLEFVDFKFKMGINSPPPVRARLDLFLMGNDSLIYSGNIRLHRLGQAHTIRVEFREPSGRENDINNTSLSKTVNEESTELEERIKLSTQEVLEISSLKDINPDDYDASNIDPPAVGHIQVPIDTNTLSYDDVYYIHFKSKKAEIKKSEQYRAEKIITELAEYLESDGEIKLLIKGHTTFPIPVKNGVQYIDTIGTEEQQRWLMDLSKERAETIKSKLVEKGIDPNKIRTQGMGYSEPVSRDLKEQYKNQRITAHLYNIKIDTALERLQTPRDSLLLTMLTELRKKPTMESSVLTKIRKGTELLIIDNGIESLEEISKYDKRYDKWYKVSFQNNQGWVFGKMTNKSYSKNVVNSDNEYKPESEDDFENIMKEGWKQIKRHYHEIYDERFDRSKVIFNLEILKGHNPKSSTNGVEEKDSFLFVYYVK